MTHTIRLAMIRRLTTVRQITKPHSANHKRVPTVRLKSPFLVRTAGRSASMALRMIFRTLDYDLHTLSVNPYGSTGPKRFLFSIWHDSAVMATFGGKHHRTVALTSRHRDGTFVASLLEGVNVKSVRGSSGRGGRRAALELLKVAMTHDIVITPDGPRGPRRIMTRGIVYLASKTGNAIVPTGFACSKTWDIRGSWTSLTIPRPFSRVVLLAGEPIHVPPGLSNSEMGSHIESVQHAMDELQQLAESQVSEPSAAPLKSIQTIVPDKAA